MIFCCSNRDAPLHLAAAQGRVEACSLLIASKADVDAQNRFALFLKCVAVSVFELKFAF
jgi:ankyrin repeat protein